MKIRTFVFTFICLFTMILAGCPIFVDSIDNHQCMSAEELTNYMNNLGLDAQFTLIKTEYMEGYDYKIRCVWLNASDLPGQTVKAYHLITNYYADSSYFEAFDNNARMTVISYGDYYYSDYMYYKFEKEIFDYFDNLYKPLTKDLEKNISYRLAISPRVENFAISEFKNYDNANDFIKHTGFNTYLIINKEFNPDVNREFNVFGYDLWNSTYIYESVLSLTCYYTTTYSAKDISEEELTEGNFYRTGEVTVKKL